MSGTLPYVAPSWYMLCFSLSCVTKCSAGISQTPLVCILFRPCLKATLSDNEALDCDSDVSFMQLWAGIDERWGIRKYCMETLSSQLFTKFCFLPEAFNTRWFMMFLHCRTSLQCVGMKQMIQFWCKGMIDFKAYADLKNTLLWLVISTYAFIAIVSNVWKWFPHATCKLLKLSMLQHRT